MAAKRGKGAPPFVALAPAKPEPAKPQVSQKPALIPPHLLPAVVFFIIYFVCLWKWVEVNLIYHSAGLVKDFPSFYWGWEFAREFRTHPGGLVEYGAALLAQSMYYSWFGALMLTLQAAVVYGGIARFLRYLRVGGLPWIGLIPVVLFLAMYSKYRHYSAPVSSFALGVVFLNAWLVLANKNAEWRLAAAIVATAGLYAAAPMGLLVFVPAAVLFEIRLRTAIWKLLVCLGLCGLIPWLEGRAVYGFAPGEAYAAILPLLWEPSAWKIMGAWTIAGVYVFPLALCLAGCAFFLLKARKDPGADPGTLPENAELTPGQEQAPVTRPGNPKPPAWRAALFDWKWQAAGLAAVAVGTVWLAVHPAVKAFLKVDYLSWHKRWPEVLRAAERNPLSPFVACAVAQADYHLEKLTFRLPALASPADLLLANDKQLSNWKKCDLYFDLGYVNMALHYLTESVEFYGERPILLERLAVVNLALGNVSTAKVYLGTLARVPFHGQWARQYLERLAVDPTLRGDEEINRLRRLMLKQDSVAALSPEDELLMLLGANRENRMAFEYLMTYYLLSKNLNGFVKNLARLKDFSGLSIGPVWDEAILLAAGFSKRAIDVPGHSIGAEGMSRVETLTKLVRKYGQNVDLGRQNLAADYGHTYTFYWFFDH